MTDQSESIHQRIEGKLDEHLHEVNDERKYIYIYIFVIFIGLMFASYLPANIRTGILTAAAIFAIHEAVKLRFANLVNTLSNIYPSSFTWFTRESYMFIGSTVAIDLLIAVPMFSPDAYSWAYTLMIITILLYSPSTSGLEYSYSI